MASNTNNARLPNLDALYATGLNENGLPRKFGAIEGELKDGIRRNLRIIDEQNAVNRYRWMFLPEGLSSNLIERILYYKGRGIFFYHEAKNQFMFLPFVLNGNIDVYGRFTGVSPLPFNGTTEDAKAKPWIPGYVLEPIYDVATEEIDWPQLMRKCVIIWDYSPQLSQTILPRRELNESIIDAESDCVPFLRTALINSTGVQGLRVNDQSEQANAAAASNAKYNAALTGQGFIPVVGTLDMQNLDGTPSSRPNEFLQIMQGLDNLRLRTMGLDSQGLFEKNAHMLAAEQALAGGHSDMILDDGLWQRQHACDIINSIFGIGIWCELSETVTDRDLDQNGYIGDSKQPQVVAQQAQPQTQPATEAEQNV